ncbi:hypothetical protein PTSG_07245 [Salpingoeca rosetta]|uniref:Ubiquitin-like domain-containing protein n=1 Tax=Salpingoeca rosetta (strain ATCC 50818 / BSB-021) TaxID=946362 RepID=F2UEH0_SALR5|nr:uncharacterized protein PTSG_07245 [Salpingoeca rosetta]EGD75020.1 hypothetical protein PTSG_07245 [Salpingoeca rosetta]|eukprot:XP_004992664.1 hypothetical protein PTSG_07245 [Salpingoeca rosetta]
MQTMVVVIKTANAPQDVRDVRVQCDTNDTVAALKTKITSCHPLKPATTDQRLIFKGVCLQDAQVLRDVLGGSEDAVVHLALRGRSCASPGATANATSASTSVSAHSLRQRRHRPTTHNQHHNQHQHQHQHQQYPSYAWWSASPATVPAPQGVTNAHDVAAWQHYMAWYQQYYAAYAQSFMHAHHVHPSNSHSHLGAFLPPYRQQLQQDHAAAHAAVGTTAPNNEHNPTRAGDTRTDNARANGDGGGDGARVGRFAQAGVGAVRIPDDDAAVNNDNQQPQAPAPAAAAGLGNDNNNNNDNAAGAGAGAGVANGINNGVNAAQAPPGGGLGGVLWWVIKAVVLLVLIGGHDNMRRLYILATMIGIAILQQLGAFQALANWLVRLQAQQNDGAHIGNDAIEGEDDEQQDNEQQDDEREDEHDANGGDDNTTPQRRRRRLPRNAAVNANRRSLMGDIGAIVLTFFTSMLPLEMAQQNLRIQQQQQRQQQQQQQQQQRRRRRRRNADNEGGDGGNDDNNAPQQQQQQQQQQQAVVM